MARGENWFLKSLLQVCVNVSDHDPGINRGPYAHVTLERVRLASVAREVVVCVVGEEVGDAALERLDKSRRLGDTPAL